MNKPRTVKAKITRSVTEVAIVVLARDGSVDEVLEILDELDTHDVEVQSIHHVLSEHN